MPLASCFGDYKMPKFRKSDKVQTVNTAKRVFIVGAMFACAFGLLLSRAVYFHLKDNAAIEKVAMRQYRTAVRQSTKRGKIVDSSGRELAIDVTVDSIYASPREIEDPVSLSERLSKILHIERRALMERISSDRKFAWIKRRATEAEAKAVADGNFKGVYSMRESSRSYPGKTLAASILGAVGFDAAPLGGIELYYNDKISATGKSRDVRRDARGHLYLSPTGESEDPKLASVELTIDKTLQYIAENELAKAVQKSNAKGGSAVVVDVNTGAVLAAANVPTFDPNNYEKFGLSSWKNRAITDAYEPGSTFKTIVVAAALDAGLVKPEDIFDCENGKIRIQNKVVKDAHPHGKLSVADIIKVSSNIGAYKIEQKLGAKRAYEAIRSFGFGSLSEIDLPGESAGILSPPERWSELQFATIAFGQGIAVTPLQMATAFAAIANGGTLLKPYIVKRIVASDGGEIYSAGRQVVRRPISEDAAKTMTELLTRVTKKGGTGTLAASLEYQTAGKTGTAQKADPHTGGYAPGRYYSSFVGFMPADRPMIAVYVGIDEPRGGMYYGGQIAAPAFREISEATLHYLKVPGSLTTVAADVENELPNKAAQELALVEAADQESKEVVKNDEQSWKLPDLKGLTMRGVLEAAGHAGITWKFTGSGIAVGQKPQPGSVVSSGQVCEVEFQSLL